MLTMMLMTSILVQAGSDDLRFSDLHVGQTIDASSDSVVISNDITNSYVYAIISDHIVQMGYTRVYENYFLSQGHKYEVIENTGQNTQYRYLTFKPFSTTHNHHFSEDWSYDNEYHWHECVADDRSDVCREEEGSKKVTHTYGTTGDAEFTCTVCGYVNTTKKVEVANTSVVEKTPSGQTNELVTILLNSNLFVRWKGDNVLVNWGTVPSADSYEVWATYCGISTFEFVTTVQGGNKATIKKLKGKKLNKKRGVKTYVVAKQGGTTLGRSLYGHSTSPKHSRTNAKKVTVKKNSYSLSVGQTAKINANTVKAKSNKKLLHNGYYRYASSNTSVATVSSGGRITAVGAGTCKVWVYALNGKSKKMTVTVK